MTKANVVLALAAGVFGVGCLVLFRDLSSERTRVHALEAQVAQLQREVKLPEPAASDSGPAHANEPAQTAPMQPAAASSTSAASTSATNKPVAAKNTAERDRQRRVLADPSYPGRQRVSTSGCGCVRNIRSSPPSSACRKRKGTASSMGRSRACAKANPRRRSSLAKTCSSGAGSCSSSRSKRDGGFSASSGFSCGPST